MQFQYVSEALLACYIASNNVGAFVADTFANVTGLINESLNLGFNLT